ncbi:MAG: mechanosensitive ion channel [Clostridia bacterium]|nr:mechanosensitive ion channel [Clostridia bacterium]
MTSDTKQIRSRLYRTLLIGIVAALGLLAASYVMIASLCAQKSKADSLYEIQTAVEHIAKNKASATELNDRFNASMQAQTNTLAILFSLGDQLMSEEGVLQCAQTSGVDDLLVLSESGEVLCSAHAILNAAGEALRYEGGGTLPGGFSNDEWNDLLSGTETFLVNLKTNVTTPQYHPLEAESEGVEKRYFSKSYQNGNVVVVAENTVQLKQGVASQSSIGNVLDKVTLGANGFAFAVSEAEQTILYHPDGQYIGATLSDAGIPADCLKNGFSGEVTIGEKRYFCNTVRAWDGAMVISAIPYGDISAERSVMTLSLLLVTSLLLIAYAYFLKKYSYQRGEAPDKAALGKDLYINKNILQKLLPVAVVTVLAAGLGITYTQALHAISEQAVTAQAGISDIRTYLEANQERAETLTAEYKDAYLKKAKLLSLLLETNPVLLSCDESAEAKDRLHTHADGAQTVAYSGLLQNICDTMHVDAIYVYDDKGQSICTNTAFWYYPIEMKDETAQSHAFSDILKGYADTVAQDAMVDDTGKLNQYVGSAYTYYDAAGARHNGLVQIAVQPSQLDETLKTTELAYQLRSMRVGRNGFFGAVNANDLTVSYSPVLDSVGKRGVDIGFKEESFRDGWSGFGRINGYEYYMTCTRIGDHFVYTLMSLSNLYAQGYAIALYTTLFNLLFALILLLAAVIGRNRDDALYTLSEEKRMGGRSLFDLVMPGGGVKRVTSAASRWEGATVPWGEKNPDQKLLALIKLLLGVIAVVLCAVFLGAGRFFGNNSILGYIVEGNWDKGVNIFSLTCCAMILLVVVVAGNLASFAIRTVSVNLGTRTETIGRLLSSVIRFVAIVYGIFRCLTLLGVDAAALLASAGILTLVIGLGAQKLIADFLAGIFIVCEGSFRVGDIVTIGGFRGSVLEIGMRTTKIMDASGDIKVFNNSDISGILNMTKEMSFAFCDVGIEYNESIERVEMVLQEAFPAIRKRLPAIKDGPFYKGISELGDSCVVIKIVAKCAEQDRVQLNRDLNREIKLVFDKNNINIPYPQVVLSYRQGEDAEQLSAKEKQRAARFVDEQKEKSKDIEEEES